jgi:hypothetical protein
MLLGLTLRGFVPEVPNFDAKNYQNQDMSAYVRNWLKTAQQPDEIEQHGTKFCFYTVKYLVAE